MTFQQFDHAVACIAVLLNEQGLKLFIVMQCSIAGNFSASMTKPELQDEELEPGLEPTG